MSGFTPKLPLPKAWPTKVRAALLHVVSLAHYSLLTARGFAADAINPRVQLQGEIDRLEQEVALLKEEIRIKDARMERIDARRRPHYAGTERLAILTLKAARGWSQAQAAQSFFLEPATIASWLKEVREGGAEALVRTSEPVNKFPEFVRAAVQTLKTLCPSLGRVKIAEVLARAGLHVAPSSVRRMTREAPVKETPPPSSPTMKEQLGRRIKAKYPNHVQHVDLSVVPTAMGLWVSFLPFSLPQIWPFAWWLLLVEDHFSRRIQGFALFKKQPTSLDVRMFFVRLFTQHNVRPKHLICDRGGQFDCEPFRAWCRRRGIKPRYGAIGRHGSIAVIERLIRTVKQECTRRMIVPLLRADLRREIEGYVFWYNEERPHRTLHGSTPNEVYFGRPVANRQPRVEPRAKWPRASSCAAPQAEMYDEPGQRIKLTIQHDHGLRPIVRLARAA